MFGGIFGWSVDITGMTRVDGFFAMTRMRQGYKKQIARAWMVWREGVGPKHTHHHPMLAMFNGVCPMERCLSIF